MMYGEWLQGLLLVLGIFGLLIREYVMVILCVVLLLARYMAQQWTKWSFDHLRYRRELSAQRIWPGERVRLTIELENNTMIPVPYLECQDEFPEGLTIEKGQVLGHHKPRRRMLYNLLGLRWYERVRRHYSLSGEQRGRYVFGPVEILTGDLLGFASHSGRQESTSTLLVYPRLYELDELPVIWCSPSGPKTIRGWLFEDPTLYAGIREYISTDPFNRIEWKASARSQQLKVRVYDASLDQAMLIALNLATHDHLWEGIDIDLLEWSICVAASISSAALSAGREVGLITNHYQVPIIQSGRSADQMTRVLDALAAIDLYTTWATPGIVPRSMQQLRSGESLLLITPRLDEVLIGELRGAFQGSVPRQVVVYTGTEPPSDHNGIRVAWIPKGGERHETNRLG